MLKAVIFANLNQNKEALEEYSKLLKIEAEALLKIEAMISIFILGQELTDCIINGLNKVKLQDYSLLKAEFSLKNQKNQIKRNSENEFNNTILN